ncbi:MAG TPA: hypothetical protein VNX66_05880 [Candidatus Sulfotelmatobacter sp.]|jgi:hypothetical protein|nr:hypothetical protein [Candidatus Sulfotelmatobacter sp.]
MKNYKSILKNCFLVVIAALFSVLFLRFEKRASASEEDKPLRVRSLEIVDRAGIARMRLGAPVPDPVMGGKSSPRRSPQNGIQINDANGDEMGGIGMLDDGSLIFCFDSRKAEATCMYSLPSGERGFSVTDNNGKDRALMEIKADKSVGVTLNNEEEKPLAIVRVMNGKSEIVLTAANGKTLWMSKK